MIVPSGKQEILIFLSDISQYSYNITVLLFFFVAWQWTMGQEKKIVARMNLNQHYYKRNYVGYMFYGNSGNNSWISLSATLYKQLTEAFLTKTEMFSLYMTRTDASLCITLPCFITCFWRKLSHFTHVAAHLSNNSWVAGLHISSLEDLEYLGYDSCSNGFIVIEIFPWELLLDCQRTHFCNQNGKNSSSTLFFTQHYILVENA